MVFWLRSRGRLVGSGSGLGSRFVRGSGLGSRLVGTGSGLRGRLVGAGSGLIRGSGVRSGLLILSLTLVGHLGNVATISINRVGNLLGATVGKVNVVRSLGVGSITLFLLAVVVLGVIVLDSPFVGVLGGVSGFGSVSGRGVVGQNGSEGKEEDEGEGLE